MIVIHPSPHADTRTCDYTKVTKEELYVTSDQHIQDVRQALDFFHDVLEKASEAHDADKLTDIDGFHANFLTGFKQQDWLERHRTLNRHHLLEPGGIPTDVNLIDVLDFIADQVMSAKGRTGKVWPIRLDISVLEQAFQNTVTLLAQEVVVQE